MKVELLKAHKDFKLNKSYIVLGLEADDLRIVNEFGKPYLYSADLFKIVDANRPKEWITLYGDDREEYSYPSPLNRVSFFEDFHDGDPKVIEEFNLYFKNLKNKL